MRPQDRGLQGRSADWRWCLTTKRRNYFALRGGDFRGQRAWGRIKATAAEQRQLWREVGEALNYGRALHPSNQAFGRWLADNGFDMDPATRSNAVWFAESVWTQSNQVPADMAHPTHIRQWLRDSSTPTPAPVVPGALPDAQLGAASEVLKNHRRYKAARDHSKGTGPEAAMQYMQKRHAQNELSRPFMLPMIAEPRDYEYLPPPQAEVLLDADD